MVVALGFVSVLACTPTDPVRNERRYWLENATVDVGQHRRIIAGPLEVYATPGGTIRTPDGRHRGRVVWPDGLPEEGRGLFLYAQAEVALTRWPDGKATGRTLLPGARVAVRPVDGGHLVAIGRGDGQPPDVCLAPPGSLSTKQVELTEARVDQERVATTAWHDGRARCGAPVLRNAAPGEPEVGGQTFGGVRQGVLIDEAQPDFPLAGGAVGCMASVIVRAPAGLVRRSPEALYDDAVAEIPRGFAQLERGLGGEGQRRLFLRLRGGGGLGVLALDRRAARCAWLTLEPSGEHTLSAAEPALDLVGLKLRAVDPRPGELPEVIVDPDCARCRPRPFVVLASAGSDEIHVTDRWLPAGAVAYLPREARRWFLSRSACEIAAARTSQRVREGVWLTDLGLHAEVSTGR